MKDAARDWLRLAEADLEVAGVVIKQGFHRHCVFECQQAIEKLVKAIWVERTPEGYPPREHDLRSLAEKAALDLSREQTGLLDDLSGQYIPSRYVDAAVEYSREQAQSYYNRTTEVFEWLR